MTPTLRQARPSRDKPVFVDRTGRRRRLTKIVGWCLAGLLVLMLGLLTAAVSGASGSRIPGFPAPVQHGEAARLTPSPSPSPSPQSTPRRVTATAGATSTPGGAGGSAPTAVTVSPSVTKRGHVPTQNPSHPTPAKTK